MPEGVKEIEYFHIELETHEVIFAEGAAVETLLVMNDHEAFASLIRENFETLPSTDLFTGPRTVL